MSISVAGLSEVGEVKTYTTSNRGLTPEEIVDILVMPKLLVVAETAAPALVDQANMFRERIRALLVRNMYQAIKSDRTTLAAKLHAIGMSDLAEKIPHL